MNALTLRPALILAVLALVSSSNAFAEKPTDVNVVNTPNVNVGNVVYVVPIEAREPVHFRYELTGGALSNELTQGLYKVPAGKRLTITFVSGIANSPLGEVVPAIGIYAGTGPGYVRAQHQVAVPAVVPSGWDTSAACLSQPMHLVVNGDEIVGFWYARSAAPQGGPTAHVSINLSGYLETVTP